MYSKTRFESMMLALSDKVSDLHQENDFDTAELLEDAIFFLSMPVIEDQLEADAELPAEEDNTMEALRELCAKMKRLQLEQVKIKAQAAEVRIPLDELRLKKIPEMMASLDLRTATFQGLGRVQTASDLYASTIKGQKEASFEWLRDCGYGDMIKDNVNSSSLKALFRRMLVEGIDIPDEIYKVTPYTRASIVKA